MEKIVLSLFALQQSGGSRWKLFEFAHAGIDALNDGGRLQGLAQFGHDSAADGLGVHGLGKDLEGKDVVVAVDDEAGEEVGLAEDHAIGVGVFDELLAIGDGLADALADEGGKIRDGGVRKHADGDLGGAAVEGGAQRLSAIVGDADQRARGDAVGGDVGAVDPDVSVFEAGGTAAGDFDGGEPGLGRFWGHGLILNPRVAGWDARPKTDDGKLTTSWPRGVRR